MGNKRRAAGFVAAGALEGAARTLAPGVVRMSPEDTARLRGMVEDVKIAAARAEMLAIEARLIALRADEAQRALVRELQGRYPGLRSDQNYTLDDVSGCWVPASRAAG